MTVHRRKETPADLHARLRGYQERYGMNTEDMVLAFYFDGETCENPDMQEWLTTYSLWCAAIREVEERYWYSEYPL